MLINQVSSLIFLVIFFTYSLQLEYEINRKLIQSPMVYDSNEERLFYDINTTMLFPVGEYDNLIMLLYMKWCKHCKEILPVYKELRSYELVKNFTFVQIECSKNKEMCSQFDIEKYPTFIVKFKGGFIPYEPGSDMVNLLEFMKKTQSSSMIPIDSIDDFYSLYTKTSPIVYVYDKTKSSMLKCLRDYEDCIELDMVFYYGIKELSNKNDGKERIMIRIAENITEEFIWEKESKCRDVHQYLHKNKFPIMKQMNANYLNRIKYHKRICIMLFMTIKQYQQLNDMIIGMFHRNKKNIVVTYAIINDSDNDDFVKKMLSYFNIKERNKPSALIYDYSVMKYSFINGDDLDFNSLLDTIPQLKYKSGDIIGDFFSSFGITVTNKQFRMFLIIIIIIVILLFIILTFCCQEDTTVTDEDKNITGKTKDDPVDITQEKKKQ